MITRFRVTVQWFVNTPNFGYKSGDNFAAEHQKLPPACHLNISSSSAFLSQVSQSVSVSEEEQAEKEISIMRHLITFVLLAITASSLVAANPQRMSKECMENHPTVVSE